MKKSTTIILLFLAFAGFLKVEGQTVNETEKDTIFRHSIGAGIGFTTGYGLSYRYTPATFGVQLNFAPYHDKEIDRYSIGLTFLYSLVRHKTTNLFLYQGNHYYYNSQMLYVYDPDPNKPYNPNPDKERVTTSYMNNGIGFGFELIIAKRIGFNLMGGFASYSNFQELNLTGETALYYKF